jgi:hypothetical protein
MVTDKEVIKFHLTNSYIESSPLVFFSGFCGALKDARKMTGRNIITGEKDSSNTFGHLGSWLGIIGYLSLLDQIGICFKRVNGPVLEANKSGIIKALKNFSPLNDSEINAIYALRNSFAHDFSLQNIHPRKVELTHHFNVNNSPTEPLTNLPIEAWDGKMETKSSNNITKINLQVLGDTVESLVTNLITLNNTGEIEIILIGGKEELVNRYSFVTGKKVI